MNKPTAEAASPAVHIVIPARLGSTRLARKVLRQIAGRSMLEWVWRVAMASEVGPVWIATDAEEVLELAQSFAASAVLTSPEHLSGTDRCAELARTLGWNESVRVINLQGDEPQMPLACLRQLAALSRNHADSVCSLYTPVLSAQEFHNPAVVKLVTDQLGRALYFSRAAIPSPRDEVLGWPNTHVRRHLGLYAYPVGLLQQLTALAPSPLELLEKLEQLRWLQHGVTIHMAQATVVPPAGVDTEADLLRVQQSWCAE